MAFLLAVAANPAVVGTAAAVALSTAGANQKADAATKAAQQQIDAAAEALDKQIAERKRVTEAAVGAAQMSPGELRSINSILATKGAALTTTMDSISKQQAQLDAMDPNVKAAGDNLYKLLTGEASKVLAPIQAQIERQRNKRMSQLAAQMGPGFMTTSAGIEAMNKFDMDAASTLSTAQQNALTQASSIYGGLTGQQQQGQSAVTNATGNVFSNALAADQSVFQAENNVQTRITNATLGGNTSTPVDFTNPVNFAGSQNIGEFMRGDALSDAGGAIFNLVGRGVGAATSLGTGMAGGGAGGGGGGSMFSTATPLSFNQQPASQNVFSTRTA